MIARLVRLVIRTKMGWRGREAVLRSRASSSMLRGAIEKEVYADPHSAVIACAAEIPQDGLSADLSGSMAAEIQLLMCGYAAPCSVRQCQGGRRCLRATPTIRAAH
jgi:hypothetical protein